MIDFSLNTVRRTRGCETPKESYVKMDLKKQKKNQEKALDKERVGTCFGRFLWRKLNN